MSVINLKNSLNSKNPLDEFEDLLEASDYGYQRQGQTRLTFSCTGKGGDYIIVVEWNEEAQAVRCSLIMTATQTSDNDTVMVNIAAFNDSVWNGYFILDGVGNTVFKTVKDLSNIETPHLYDIEETIDQAVQEMDRFATVMELETASTDDLFLDEKKEQDLLLLLSDTVGTA